MPAPTPSGVLSLPVHNLRLLVAASTTFQTWVGATGADAAAKAASALLKVFRTNVKEEDISRPCAIVGFADDYIIDVSRASSFAPVPIGSLWLEFEQTVGSTYTDDDDIETDFSNTVGAILYEMGVASNTAGGGYLIVPRFEHVIGPVRSKIERSSDLMHWVWNVPFGINR